MKVKLCKKGSFSTGFPFQKIFCMGNIGTEWREGKGTQGPWEERGICGIQSPGMKQGGERLAAKPWSSPGVWHGGSFQGHGRTPGGMLEPLVCIMCPACRCNNMCNCLFKKCRLQLLFDPDVLLLIFSAGRNHKKVWWKWCQSPGLKACACHCKAGYTVHLK